MKSPGERIDEILNELYKTHSIEAAKKDPVIRLEIFMIAVLKYFDEN